MLVGTSAHTKKDFSIFVCNLFGQLTSFGFWALDLLPLLLCGEPQRIGSLRREEMIRRAGPRIENHMVEAVIFDIDGTIIDSVDMHIEAWNRTFKRFGK